MKGKKEITAIDIEKQVITSCGTAYFRISRELKEFLSICNEKHGIMGFEYEDRSFNFGVILENENKSND